MHEPCPMPASFPLAPYDTLCNLLGDVSHVRGSGRCGSGLNAIAFRYRGAVEAHERFKAVFSASFGGEQRYAEEDAAYLLFMHGVSTIECAAFAIFHLGAIICDCDLPDAALHGAKFPIATAKDLENIGLESTRKAFAKHFTGTKLAKALDDCKNDQARNKLYEYRAVAAHRLVLPRHNVMGPIINGVARIEPSNVVQVLIDGAPKTTGGPPVRVPLDASFSESHLKCVTRWTNELLGAAADLAEKRLPGVKQRVPHPASSATP